MFDADSSVASKAPDRNDPPRPNASAWSVRVADGIGFAGAMAVGLLLAHRAIPLIVERLGQWFPLPGPVEGAIEQPRPTEAFRVYAVALSTAFSAVALFGLALRLTRGRPRLRSLLCVATPCIAAVVALAYRRHAVVVVGAAMALAVPALLGTAAPARRASRTTRVAYALAGEGMCLVWGAWLVAVGSGATPALLAVASALAVVVWRATYLLFSGRAKLATAMRDARAFAFLAVAPLFGLLRSPSPTLLAELVALCLAVRFVPRVRRRWRPPARSLVLSNTWACLAILDVPLRIRELPNIDFDGHESGHCAWVNSALHGKLLMADASTIYGPLREYFLAAFLLLFGKTALMLRVAQVVINLLGLAALLPALWRLARRRLSLLVLGAYLVLIGTHVSIFLDYFQNYSFGWADFARIAFPSALAFVGVGAVVEGARARPRMRALLVGAGATACAWYAQENSLVVVAIACGALSEPLLARRRAEDARAAVKLCGVFLLGAVGACAVLLLPYVLAGKAGLFLRTIVTTTSFFDAGYGSMPFPLTGDDVLSWSALTAMTAPGVEGARRIEFLLPPAIYVLQGTVLIARAFRRRWAPEDASKLSLLLFGAGIFRVAAGRADALHLMSIALPAVLLSVGLLSETVDGVIALLRERGERVVVPLAVLGIVLLTSRGTGLGRGLAQKVSDLLTGVEKPSSGPKYAYPRMPRAGDMRISAHVADLVKLVVENSTPSDPIFFRGGQTFGGQYYFLSNRRNPTRFDLPHEVFTRALEHEELGELERDPPKVILTQYTGRESAETTAFFERRYKLVGKIGDIAVSVRTGR